MEPHMGSAHPSLVRAIVLAAASAVAGGVVTGSGPGRATQGPVFADVAPLVHARCAPCHHPEGAGPFPLLSYDDVALHAPEIRRVTATRYMPPWRPFPGSVAYRNDRSLTTAEIDLLARWIDAGARRGAPADDPSPPVFTGGWQLGRPDVVLQMATPFSLGPDGSDVYRNFVIPSTMARPRWVRAWELRPGTRAIHHAIVNVDRMGLARRRDALDAEAGYPGMDVGDVQSPGGFYLVWTPGKTPTPPEPDAAWPIDEHTDLVLQLHMQPTGKPEAIHPTIGLYFTDRPPSRPRLTFRVGDPNIDIPPGAPAHVVHAEDVLADDAEMVSLFPHAHYLARKVRTWARLPEGSERLLLRIDDWDFDWQDSYTFERPIALPRGTVIHVEITYDNSAANPRNPSNPPRRVTTGERSTDEMGNVTFEIIPAGPTAMNRFRAARYRRELAASETGRHHYNLANALADLGSPDEAIDHYRRALVLTPDLGPARFNLGRLLVARGRGEEGVAELRVAVKAAPRDAAARVALAGGLEGLGRRDAALSELRAAVQADPASSLAHNALAHALAGRGDRAAAIAEYRAALAIDPRNARSRRELADVLRTDGRVAEADVEERAALETDPK